VYALYAGTTRHFWFGTPNAFEEIQINCRSPVKPAKIAEHDDHRYRSKNQFFSELPNYVKNQFARSQQMAVGKESTRPYTNSARVNSARVNSAHFTKIYRPTTYYFALHVVKVNE
jgi:hypothetical protein